VVEIIIEGMNMDIKGVGWIELLKNKYRSFIEYGLTMGNLF